jgi:hypothetical protein
VKDTKDDLRRETETHAGFSFTAQEWGVIKTLSSPNIVRIGRILAKAYSTGHEDAITEERMLEESSPTQ